MADLAAVLYILGGLAIGGVLALLIWRRFFHLAVGQAVDASKPYGYFFVKHQPNVVCYLERKSAAPRVMRDVDVATLQVISHAFAKDKQHVFYQDQIIAADAASFYLDVDGTPKDAKHVYVVTTDDAGRVIAQTIAGADPKSFAKLPEREHWARDQQGYFFKARRLSVAAQSFAFLSVHWARDETTLYRVHEEGVAPVMADLSSLQVLNAFYVRDNERIYFNGVMPGVEVSARSRLISLDVPADGVVELVSEYHLRYRNKIYYCGTATQLDAETFQPFLHGGRLFHGFSKDKHSVYKFNKRLSHIHAQTFCIDNQVARDKYNLYDIDGDIFSSPIQG